jgi:hypothetical protein
MRDSVPLLGARPAAEARPQVACLAVPPAGPTAGRRVCGMVLAQRKVLLLAADDFEDMELLYPLYRLREEDVAVAGLDDHPVTGKKGHGPVPVGTPGSARPSPKLARL